MLIAVGTFALILVAVLAPYWLFVVRPEAQEAARLQGRLKGKLTKSPVFAGLLREQERLSAVRAFDALLTYSSRLTGPMQRMLAQSGVRMTLGTLLLMSGCLGGVGYLVALRLTRMPFAAVILAGLLASLPCLYVQRQRTTRLRKLEEQLPEAIDLLSRALRAGHAITTGLQMVGDELPNPIRDEFRLLYDQQSFGLSLPEALRQFSDRMPLLDAKFFVTALLTQRETGGNLAEVLDNLSTIIRERFKVKRQVRVISAHGRITGWVLVALPPGLAMALLFIMPEHYEKLYTDPLGIRMVLVAVLMQLTGAVIIRKIVNIEY